MYGSNDPSRMSELAPLPRGRPRRIAYFGTPEMAVGPLRALVAAGFEVVLVVTRPDKRRGRGAATTASPVKAAAIELGLPVSHRVDDCLEIDADLGVVVAFGQLIKAHVLVALPMVNLHFSLLPRWRGAAPVERAILAGDVETGVCLMRLEEGLDSGGLLAVARVPLDDLITADALREQLVTVGTSLLVDSLQRGLGEASAQIGRVVYADKLRPAEFELDWTKSAVEVNRMVRLGVAWTTFRGRRLKILALTVLGEQGHPGRLSQPLVVGCGSGSVQLQSVQPEGKQPMAATAWANGARPVVGETMNEQVD